MMLACRIRWIRGRFDLTTMRRQPADANQIRYL
jgi:hypothetical protein